MRLWNRYIAESLESRLLLSVDAQSTPTTFGGMPAVFVPNRGQWDEAIDFAAHGTGADILFTDTGPTFRIVENHLFLRERSAAQQSGEGPSTTPVTVNEWSLTFVNAARVSPVGLDRKPTVFNYYLGDEPSTWRSNVSSFGGVVYPDLWPGIDAHVIAQHDGMKYEFHLDPGADPRDIALRYEGVQGLSLHKSGGLSIRTHGGTITDDAPIAWQERRDGTRVEVLAEFVLLDKFTYTISPKGTYDPKLPLVLDPQLEFGSFLGGSLADHGFAITADEAKGVWVTGSTESINFPFLHGFDASLNGNRDAFVAHVTLDGTLDFASFLGGTGNDVGSALSRTNTGAIWITGSTLSPDFPVTPEGFDTTYNDDLMGDAFAVRLRANGSLAFSSFLGGASSDEGVGIVATDAGGAWITGQTGSINFPTTPDAFDTTFNGGLLGDAFVARISADLTLAYASYLGGGGSELGHGVVLSNTGGVWVTGSTASGDFPTLGAFDSSLAGEDDAFVARVNLTGTLAFASYLGGNSSDSAQAIASDGAGGVWLTGNTHSNNFPVPGGFDTSYNGAEDAFVARIAVGGNLVLASYLGGSSTEEGRGIVPDGAGGAWLTGDTESTNFPTPGGFDTTYNGSFSDTFVARVSASGTLAFGTYLGGSGTDRSFGIVRDNAAGTWLTGRTNSVNFPTPGGFDTTHNGSNDVFIARITEDTTPPTVTTSQFAFETAPQSIRITFSENVSASLSLDDLTLENLTTGQTIPSSNLALSYNTASNIATITFPGYEHGALPDGTYRATLLASGVTDPAGNPLAADHVLNFFFMQGDADHNGVIDGDDYAIIDNGFNNQLTGFLNGDFNYDGVIDGDDYAIIDWAFNTQ
jgi:hypothetical protein